MRLKISTTRFGEVAVDQEKIIRFAHGLPGFEEERAFVLVPYDEKSPFVFLQSTQTPELAFLLTNPFLFFPDYAVELDDDTLAQLELADEKDVLVYGIVTVPGGCVPDMTLNLLAPIVVNTRAQAARQIVLDKSAYKTKHPLFTERMAAEEKGGV